MVISWMVNLSGLLLLVAVVYWFFLSHVKSKKIENENIDIIVDKGVYEPSIIRVKQGQNICLNFIRKDESPCSEFVIFDTLGISAKLPLDRPYELTVDLSEKGEFDFTCQMGMYRGKLIVE